MSSSAARSSRRPIRASTVCRRTTAIADYQKEVGAALTAAGYPARADPAGVNRWQVIGLIVLTQLFTAMIYGPMAAMLVELFPARIRYTSMSLPYHIGNGWFGGLLPTIVFAIQAATGNIYAGILVSCGSGSGHVRGRALLPAGDKEPGYSRLMTKKLCCLLVGLPMPEGDGALHR